MTTKEAKALIGKPIKYNRLSHAYLSWQHATVLDVKGKNIMVDCMGMTDWLWLPDIQIVPITTSDAQ